MYGSPPYKDSNGLSFAGAGVRSSLPMERRPVVTEKAEIERAYDAAQYFALGIYGDVWEYRGDATAAEVLIDVGESYPVKKVWIKNTGLAGMLYFCIGGPGAASGNNSRSLEVAPGETREFTLTGVRFFSVDGNLYRLTVGV